MARKWIVKQSLVAEPAPCEAEIIYPDSDGEKMAENNLQQRAICYATGALRAHFRDRSDVHVRGDMFIYYRDGDPEIKIVPDVFVVFGDVVVPQMSYRVWETGVVPQFVMEVASKSTHLEDRDKKAGKYQRMGVLEYWRFDPTGALFRPPELGRCVLGQRLGRSGMYEPIEPGPGAWPRSEVLELDVCEVEGRLRFWDYKQNRILASHSEERREREQAEWEREEERRLRVASERRATKAEQEQAAERRLRTKAERRVADAEAELARLRALLASTRNK